MLPIHRVAVLALAGTCLVLAGARTPVGLQSQHHGSRHGRATNNTGSDAQCPVRGVWDLVSVSVDGKDQPLNGYRQMHVLTERHSLWIGQSARRDTLPLKSEIDTLRAYRIAGGAGTYSTRGTSYTEHLDYFFDPSWVGTSFRAICRIEGDRWYHSYTVPNDTTTARGPYQHIIEVWRRIE